MVRHSQTFQDGVCEGNERDEFVLISMNYFFDRQHHQAQLGGRYYVVRGIEFVSADRQNA